MFATVCPGTALRLDAVGMAEPDGQAVTYVAAVALVAVTLATTPMAPAGTPAVETASSRLSPAWNVAPPSTARVSITRIGTIGWNPLVYQPVTSTTTWASPAK